MKKIIAVIAPLTIAAALLGAPALNLTRAEEDSSAAKTARAALEKKRQDVRQQGREERGEIRQQTREKEEALRGEVRQARQEKETAIDALRDLKKSDIKELQKKLKEAAGPEREALRQAINDKKKAFQKKIEDEQKKFQEKRDKLRKSMNENSVAGRKQGFHAFTKERLRLLSLIKERIILEDIGDADKTRLIAEVDKLIGQLTAFDAEVDQKTTKDELKLLARKIREAIAASKEARKAIRAEMRAARQTSPTTVSPATTPSETTPPAATPAQ